MCEKAENVSNEKNENFFINFNQDYSSCSVVSTNGYRLFSIQSVERVDEIFFNNDNDTKMAERLLASSLVVLVPKKTPNKLKVCHFKKLTEICNYKYSSDIQRVMLNRHRLVVCLADKIYIHNIRDMRLLHSILDLPDNRQGLCTLSMNSLLAYPISDTCGELQIFDATNLTMRRKIMAHDSPLSAMSFSFDGMLIATASQKGTVIRVFCVKTGQNLQEFRRGVKRYVTIASLTFSSCSNYICVSSNTETVHVFKLDAKVLEQAEQLTAANTEDEVEVPEQSFSLSGLISTAASYLIPTSVLVQERAFATIQLREAGLKNKVVVTKLDQETRILVACEDGFIYVYDFDEVKGGDCKLIRVHDVRGNLHEVIEVDNTGNDLEVPAEQKEPIKMTATVAPGTYAGVLKGRPKDRMSESDKCRDLVEAVQYPIKSTIPLFDDTQFPPVTAVAAE